MDDTYSLQNIAIYAANEYLDYFGAPPPPFCTPWGLMTRYKKASEGIFFLETDRSEWVLALPNPIWTIELSDVAAQMGKTCEPDSRTGEDAEYLFFKRDSCAPPIYELLKNSEHDGLLAFIRSKDALETHLNLRFPAYVIWHNSIQVSSHGFSNSPALLGMEECDLESDERVKEEQDQCIANCIHYTPGLSDVEYLLLP